MSGFIHLHGHSTFSFLDGYGTPEQIAERAVELGHTSLAITDHGNVFAHVPWQKAAKAHGINPIFGCEFYVVDDMRDRVKGVESIGASGYPHVTIIAKNQVGYRNLLALSRGSYVDGFYYKPRVDWDEIAKYQEGLIVLSGCVGGYPSRLLVNKGAEEASAFMAKQAARIQNYFVELIPEPGLDISHQTFPVLAAIAQELKIPAVVTADAHFPRPEQHWIQDAMLSVGIRKRVDDPTRDLRLPEYQYYCDLDAIVKRCQEVGPEVPIAYLRDAIDRSGRLAAQCQVEIPRASRVIFAGLKQGETAESLLWQWVVAGVAERKGMGQIPVEREAEYAARAKHEFLVIKRKGFCDYMLAIIDVCRWMKEQNNLVMCRGSAGGCLLLWLTGASETDPVLHDLAFERFYDDNRPDPPDVDVDFERGKRDAAIQYIYETYGRENCSQIAALSKLKAKAALQDAGFALGISRNEYAALSAALDSQDEDMDRQVGEIQDPQALDTIRRHPRLIKMMEGMIGQYRQSSIHAAGVLVSSQPLADSIGVVLGADKQPIAAVDKKGAQDLGFLKMDFLSVNGLDVIASTVRKLKKPMTWLYSLPLDDEKALAIGRSGMLAGVFQLDGAAAARVSGQIGLTTFDDIAAAGGLCRPGPAEWVPIYQKHKTDPAAFAAYLTSMHPIAAEIVRPTWGIIIYQEQLMRFARELSGMEWPEVHKLRKGVCDKLGLDPQKGPAWRAEWLAKFIDGCLANGVSQAEAEFWWKSIESHGGYSFNKAHCYTYGIVGYWMLYLKARHPAEFYEAYLQHEDKDVTIKKLIAEFRSMGGEVRLLDPAHSKATFSSPEPGVLVGGLCNIKGIGPQTAKKALDQAPFTDWNHLLSAVGHANGERIRRTGVMTGEWEAQEVVLIAPWFPVPSTGWREAEIRDRYGLATTQDIPRGESLQGDAMVAGYVTASHISGDKMIFVLEDENGALVFRVPYRLVKEVGQAFKELIISDYVCVKGWWAGDVLYAKEVVVLRRHEAKAMPAAPGGKKGKLDLAALLPDLPELEGVLY